MRTHPKLLPKWRLASIATGQEHDPGTCTRSISRPIGHVHATGTFVQQTAADEISGTCRCSLCGYAFNHASWEQHCAAQSRKDDLDLFSNTSDKILSLGRQDPVFGKTRSTLSQSLSFSGLSLFF